MFSGHMLSQYTAGMMVVEQRILSQPSYTQSIPAAADQEDFVSMGMNARPQDAADPGERLRASSESSSSPRPRRSTSASSRPESARGRPRRGAPRRRAPRGGPPALHRPQQHDGGGGAVRRPGRRWRRRSGSCRRAGTPASRALLCGESIRAGPARPLSGRRDRSSRLRRRLAAGARFGHLAREAIAFAPRAAQKSSERACPNARSRPCRSSLQAGAAARPSLQDVSRIRRAAVRPSHGAPMPEPATHTPDERPARTIGSPPEPV